MASLEAEGPVVPGVVSEARVHGEGCEEVRTPGVTVHSLYENNVRSDASLAQDGNSCTSSNEADASMKILLQTLLAITPALATLPAAVAQLSARLDGHEAMAKAAGTTELHVPTAATAFQQKREARVANPGSAFHEASCGADDLNNHELHVLAHMMVPQRLSVRALIR